LWASWKDGGISNWKDPNASPETIVEHLSTSYESDSDRLHTASEQWAAFQFGSEDSFQFGSDGANDVRSSASGDDDESLFYLDVIGLGEYCWPKPAGISTPDQSDQDGLNQDSPKNWPVPRRGREAAIDGFNKSRKITPVIESTFGLVIAKHLPRRVEAMGGDEMKFRMPASQWLPLLENIESHCAHLHSTIFQEDPRLLWWAMHTPSSDSQKLDFTNMKQTIRGLSSDSVALSRFVNPIWWNLVRRS
jgi:hypothetical protein